MTVKEELDLFVDKVRAEEKEGGITTTLLHVHANLVARWAFKRAQEEMRCILRDMISRGEAANICKKLAKAME